ncbi:tripartite motif-containing protein 14-like [Brachyhypopomus gauderio]|uniref:tripartite motif-containing protein 14-like n=1 Tax=Brachyhypopomus gauderio TaxID=698409 RepID=UPI004042A672
MSPHSSSLISIRSRTPSDKCDAYRHVSTIILYCVNCNETLCDHCLINGSHRDHKYETLQDAVKNRLEKIKVESTKLASNVANFQDIKARVSVAEQELEAKYDRIKRNITEKYTELYTILEKNQQNAFQLLEAEKESLEDCLSRITEAGDTYQQTSLAMQENIKMLRMRKKIESAASLLVGIKELEMSLENMEEYYSTLNEHVKSNGTRLRAMQESVKRIFNKNKEILPRPWQFSAAITFDQDNKHKELTVSEDKTQVSLRGLSTKHTKDTRALSANILASQRFSKGQHYWEVDVTGSKNWSVGVVLHDKSKNGVNRQLGKDKRSWVLESDEGELTALHDNEVRRVKEASVQRLGVFVDCDKGRLNFYDVITGNKLHMFITRFKGSVCPAFGLGAQANSIAQLLIYSLTPRGVHYNSAGEESVDSGTYDMQDGERIEVASL